MEKKTDWSERGKMGPNAFPFWSKQSKRGNLKYWHFASTTCRQCLQLAGRVYLWCTVSTEPRPPTPYMRVNDCSGPFWGKGAFGPLPKYWHFASTTCRQCLQLAGRVYLWCTVSTDPRPPTPYMRVNDCSGPFWGKGAEYWHFASTTCRQCLQLAGRVYLWCTVSTDPRPPSPSMRVNDGSGPYIYIHIYVVRHSTTRRTVSYFVVQCRTVSYCVVLCRTVSYSVVLCRTVSYSVLQCRTSVVRHCTARRTVSYKVSGPDASGMYDASYSVVQGVGARRVGDVRRVGRCRGPTRRKIPTSTVVLHPPQCVHLRKCAPGGLWRSEVIDELAALIWGETLGGIDVDHRLGLSTGTLHMCEARALSLAGCRLVLANCKCERAPCRQWFHLRRTGVYSDCGLVDWPPASVAPDDLCSRRPLPTGEGGGEICTQKIFFMPFPLPQGLFAKKKVNWNFFTQGQLLVQKWNFLHQN